MSGVGLIGVGECFLYLCGFVLLNVCCFGRKVVFIFCVICFCGVILDVILVLFFVYLFVVGFFWFGSGCFDRIFGVWC